MKPNEYVKKYNLENSEYFDHSSLVSDLTIDFQSLIEFQKTVGQYSYSHFENIVKQIHQKFNSISLKSKMVQDKWNNLWNFFYASVVVKVRDVDFGEFLNKQKKAKQEDWRSRNSWRSYYGSGNDFKANFTFDFSEFFNQFFEENIINNIIKNIVPVNDFLELGLVAETSTVDDVKSQFRKLSIQYHPDKGGSTQKFQSILESKNRCLMYLQKK
jgi:hypothetical protein